MRRAAAAVFCCAAALCSGATALHAEIRARVFKLITDGTQAYKDGRNADAIKMLEEAANIALNSFKAYYYLGLALKADRQYQRAIEPLQIAIELDPVNLAARVALGDCYLKRGDPPEALAEYHRALSLGADYAPAYDGLGRAAEAAGETEKAIEHYRKAIELNPGFPDSALNLGDLFLREGRTTEAIQLFLTAIKVRPDFAAAYNRLGVAYSRQRFNNEAIAALRQAEVLEKGNPWHGVTIGGIYMDLGSLVLAQRELDQALALDPDFLEVYQARARLKRRVGDLAGAQEEIKAGLARKSDDAHGIEQLAETATRLADESRRLTELNATLDSKPRDIPTLLALADLRVSFGDFPAAVQLLLEAEKAAGGDADSALLGRLSYAALRAGQFDEAARAAESLVKLSPGDPGLQLNLGLARLGLGQTPEAEVALREAARLKPGDPSPLCYLGDLYAIEGKFAKAIETLLAATAMTAEGSEERSRIERLIRALQSRSGEGA
jgi:tetratricopeptide (TPR) repeat protein